LLVIVTANKLRNSVPVLFVTMMAGLMPDNRGAPLIAITLINFAWSSSNAASVRATPQGTNC
jgi:hypothetical protein